MSETEHTLWVEPDHTLPLVHLQIVLPSGALADPPDKPGLTRLAAQMLRRGTKARDARAFEEALDQLGAALSVETGWGHVRLGASVLRRNLEPLLELVGEALREPALDEGQLAQLKQETRAALVEARDRDQSLVATHFRRAQFAGHPYGGTIIGTSRSLARITPEDVRDAYRARLRPRPLLVGLAGDVDTDTAARLVREALPAASAGQAPRPAPPEPSQRPGRHLRIVDKPQRSQCQVYIGRLGTSPRDPDHHALIVADAAFGGTFTARLTREVRSERGWSYGASSYLSVDRVRDTWSMWTFPAAADTVDCIKLQLELMESWCQQGITEEELAVAQGYLIKSRAFAVDTASKRLEQRIESRLAELPDDYWDCYADRIRAVNVDAAGAAVAERLRPEDLTLTVVATAAQLEPGLRALPGVDSVEVVPFDHED